MRSSPGGPGVACEATAPVAGLASCLAGLRRKRLRAVPDDDMATLEFECAVSVGYRSQGTSTSLACAIEAEHGPRCDKCDGPHCTEACPHFKKPRSDHKDAWASFGEKGLRQIGESGGRQLLCERRALVRQPPDGSCLYHSLCLGLCGVQGDDAPGSAARELRRELAQFVATNPQVEISGDTLEEWVRWGENSSVGAYSRRMAVSGWGGGIEMAVCSLLKRVNVHVYERREDGAYERITRFDSPEPTQKTIEVLYQGGVHYDALLRCC